MGVVPYNATITFCPISWANVGAARAGEAVANGSESAMTAANRMGCHRPALTGFITA
jgi:hypothetical protein